MTTPSPRQSAIVLAAADVRPWRQALKAQRIAVVTGTYDILQPGNLLALQTAARHADQVCVVLEPDDIVAAHAGKGRPQNPLSVRAEFVAGLKPVSMVAAADTMVKAGELFAALRPFTWVSCSSLRQQDPFADMADQAAEATVETPLVAGGTTAQIHASIRAGCTPIPVVWPPELEPQGHLPKADQAAKKQPKRVTVNGCFDILHIGHLRFLEKAREMGDELIVLTNDDDSIRRYKGAGRPVFPLPFRMAALQALKSVSSVRSFPEDTPMALLATLKPDVHVKGGSFEKERVSEEQRLVESWGGRLAFCPLVQGYSTSDHVRQVLNLPPGG